MLLNISTQPNAKRWNLSMPYLPNRIALVLSESCKDKGCWYLTQGYLHACGVELLWAVRVSCFNLNLKCF